MKKFIAILALVMGASVSMLAQADDSQTMPAAPDANQAAPQGQMGDQQNGQQNGQAGDQQNGSMNDQTAPTPAPAPAASSDDTDSNAAGSTDSTPVQPQH